VGLIPIQSWMVGEDILESFTFGLTDVDDDEVGNTNRRQNALFQKRHKRKDDQKPMEGDGNRICHGFFDFARNDDEEHSQGFMLAYAPKTPPKTFLPADLLSKRLKQHEVLSYYLQMTELDECPRGGTFVEWFEGLAESIVTNLKEGNEKEEENEEEEDD